jgi:hypothetical protein
LIDTDTADVGERVHPGGLERPRRRRSDAREIGSVHEPTVRVGGSVNSGRPYRAVRRGGTMRILSTVARGLGWLLTTVAKTMGGMRGAKPFTDSHAAQVPPRHEDYRP